MKYAISFFGILVLLVSGMLFFQFQVYSNKADTEEEDFTYTQEIEITYRNQSLDIRQHFKNLPNQTIDIVWPKLATNSDCFMDTENSCKRLSDDKTKFEQGENNIQSLSYIIPLNNGLKSKQLLKDIFVSLPNGEVTYSTVHISTDSDVSGQWVTGLPIIGHQALSLVNYTMFAGTGPVTELYWQAGELNLQKTNEFLSIYSKKTLSDKFNQQLKDIKFLNDEHIAIIQGESLSKEQGNRILFVSDLTIDSLKQNVILTQAKAQYKSTNNPQWLYEVVASFLTGNTIGGGKSAEIVNTLKHQMTDKQYEDWVSKLNSLKRKEISAKILDETLSEVFGIHTDYLSLNASTKKVFPFMFNDNREVVVNSQKQEDIEVIFQNGLVLYSADALLNRLGYKTSVGKNGYYVQNELKNYRFPKNYGFYVYNERRYNTVSEPIVEVAGSQYIEETWLQKLFSVEIEKSKDSILIKATAQQ